MSPPRSLPPSRLSAAEGSGVLPLIHPLDEFYLQAGRPLPAVESLPGTAIPEPERSLLVHEHDMTSTLAAFHGDSMHLEVLHRETRGDNHLRLVVLRLDGSQKPVEFGAIKIHLNLLPAPARRLILEAHLPLGRILHDCHVAFLSRPRAFLQVRPDAFILSALGLTKGCALYGRRNTLSDPGHRPIAEIMELLPPSDRHPTPGT